MAQPKKKRSHSKQGHTRHHWKARPPTLTVCSRCREPRLTHHACNACGYYRGRQVLKVKEPQQS